MSWPAATGSAHRALRYRDEPEFRALVGSFIREGLDRGERVLAAVPAGRLDWIRAELGGDPPGVEFLLRVMVEAPSAEEAEQVCGRLVERARAAAVEMAP